MDYHIYYIFLTVADRIHKNISISMSFHRMQMDTKIKKSMNHTKKFSHNNLVVPKFVDLGIVDLVTNT